MKKKLLKHSDLNLIISENNLILIHNIGENLKEKETIGYNYDKQTGAILNQNNIKSKRAKMLGSIGGVQYEYFLYAFHKISAYKKKSFDAETLISMDENPSLKNYIDSIGESKSKIFFNSVIADKGYWLLETDNKSYYKILFFNK